MDFLLQVTDDRNVCFDFVLSASTAIKYLNWKDLVDVTGSGCEHRYELKTYEEVVNIGKDPEERQKYLNYIPIGSIEFVQEFISSVVFQSHEEWTKLRPINVPESLFGWSREAALAAGRTKTVIRENIEKGNPSDASKIKEVYSASNGRCFVKSNEVLKSSLNGVYSLKDFGNLPNGKYQISTLIEEDIQAEYRCFVFMDNLLDVRRYSGDYKVTPNIEDIDKIMSKYAWNQGNGPAPIAYTLDVALIVDDKGHIITEVIECHEFFSCGLYGFDDLYHLPYMFYRQFNEIVKRKEKENKVIKSKLFKL